MKKLLPGMDSCVSSAASRNLYVFTSYQGQFFLNYLLDAERIGLDLPAMIVCSFI
jgi:hypothetical protein